MAYTKEQIGAGILKVREIVQALGVFGEMESILRMYVGVLEGQAEHEKAKVQRAAELEDIRKRTADAEAQRHDAASELGKVRDNLKKRKAQADQEFAAHSAGKEAEMRTLDGEISKRKAELNTLASAYAEKRQQLDDLQRQFNNFARDHGLAIRP